MPEVESVVVGKGGNGISTPGDDLQAVLEQQYVHGEPGDGEHGTEDLKCLLPGNPDSRIEDADDR